MNTNKIISTVAFMVLVGAVVYFIPSKNGAQVPSVPEVSQNQPAFDPKNATYEIDGKSVTLVDGVSETEAAPGSASKVTTRYFGNEAKGDLNNDGKDDMAFLISQSGGGSGLFYYAVVALATGDGYKMTNAFFVGDRIAPQTTEINTSAQELRVNFAERKPGEPMTARPSMGVTLYLKVTPEGVLTGLMQ